MRGKGELGRILTSRGKRERVKKGRRGNASMNGRTKLGGEEGKKEGGALGGMGGGLKDKGKR